MPKQPTPEQELVALIIQAHRLLTMLEEGQKQLTAASNSRKARSLPVGIYPTSSKYNPWRAYVWNGQKMLYLGAFPSINKAKIAQRAYRNGRQPADGTRVANRRPPLAILKKG